LRPISPSELATRLRGTGELALLDAREQGAFHGEHLFHASCVPLSRLEQRLPALVPRSTTPIVWCDAGDGSDLALRAAHRARELGWTSVAVLEGGNRAWREAGHLLYGGVNVPSKAFGELVETRHGTPHVPPRRLAEMIAAGEKLVILDSRPLEEFRRMSIPTALDCPGAELVHRVGQVVSDPETTVVVNCAGRTRSIIGAQSLINAGLENPVLALENGTMGWELAGLHTVRGADAVAPRPGPEVAARAATAAARVGRRFGVRTVDTATVGGWLDEPDRTTVVLDVRSPEEYRAGHVEGVPNAPGGQLVQATDEYVATRGARLVLLDDDGTRANMTASWLRQLGWGDTFVLSDPEALPGLGLKPPDVPSPPPVAEIGDAELTERTGDPRTVVIDVGSSLSHRDRGHVPGAWWTVRSRLGDLLGADQPGIEEGTLLVFTSSDGTLASWAAHDAAALWPGVEIRVLRGGTRAWLEGGWETETGMIRPLTTVDDVWYKPYDRAQGRAAEEHMREYLSWEVALVDKIGRDPLVSFPEFD